MGHRRGAHPIRLRLDDGGDALPGLGRCLQCTDVVGHGIQVDFDPTQH
jgi:hypothetical protein